MHLVIQIPCLNEEGSIETVISSIPQSIPGVRTISTLVIDDGSEDCTGERAKNAGALVVRNTGRQGLAYTFERGLKESLALGADIIVNIDGDNQYKGEEIPALIEPILAGSADMVVGDRNPGDNHSFSFTKRLLQRFGSWVLRKLSGTEVRDAASGFRAFSRVAASRLTILSHYTYTHETILQAKKKGLVVANVPVTYNPPVRESRLMRSIPHYLLYSAVTILRTFAMYNPLRIFTALALCSTTIGAVLCGRFLFYYFYLGVSGGKIQSLIFGAIFLLAGVMFALIGVLADLLQGQRRLIERLVEDSSIRKN